LLVVCYKSVRELKVLNISSFFIILEKGDFMKKVLTLLFVFVLSVVLLTPTLISANTNPATNVNTGWSYEDNHAFLVNTFRPLATKRNSKWDPGAFEWTVVSPTNEFMAVLSPIITQEEDEDSGEMIDVDNGYTSLATDLLTQTGVSSDSYNAVVDFYNNYGGMTNGTWMTKVITLSANETITMWWNYVSSDYVPYNDGAMATFTPAGGAATTGKINDVLTDYMILAGTNPGTGTYSTNSYGSTGWQSVTFTALTAGDYKVSFLVYDLSDTALSPFLAVSHQQGTTLKDGKDFPPIEPDRNFGKPQEEWVFHVKVLNPNGQLIATIVVPYQTQLTSDLVTFPTPTFGTFTFYGYGFAPSLFIIEAEGEDVFQTLEEYVNYFFENGVEWDIEVYAVFDVPEDFEPLPETSDLDLNVWILLLAGAVLISLSFKSKRLVF
jgi:hypothetical protein